MSRPHLKSHFADRAQRGFTLVEMMVVVAMVGVLSAISISRYQLFVAKVRMTEAKIILSALYTTEKSFSVESSSYSICIRWLGYQPYSGSVINNYYLSGFWRGSDTKTCGPAGNSSCFQTNFTDGAPQCQCSPSAMYPDGGNDCTYAANSKVGAPAANYSNFSFVDSQINVWTVTQNTFLAGAAGSISSANFYDIWTIDDKRTLNHLVTGLR